MTRFHTRPLGLVARTTDGTLVEMGLDDGRTARLAGPGVAAFAVGPAGTIAYVDPAQGQLVLRVRSGERRIALPAGVEACDLEWAPGERVLLFLAVADDAQGAPYVVRADDGTVTPFGPRPGPIDPGSALVVEALKKSLVEIVYRRESSPSHRTAARLSCATSTGTSR